MDSPIAVVYRNAPPAGRHSPMAAQDKLTDQERSILAFAEADLTKRGLRLALAMVRNPKAKPANLRAVIDYYREGWLRRLN
jgi:hypothetical protein